MSKLVKCAICGKEFITNRPNKKYCGLSCSAAGVRLKRMNWEDRNPLYMTEYMRTYRRKDKKQA